MIPSSSERSLNIAEGLIIGRKSLYVPSFSMRENMSNKFTFFSPAEWKIKLHVMTIRKY